MTVSRSGRIAGGPGAVRACGRPHDTCHLLFLARFQRHQPYAYGLERLGFYDREFRRLMAHGRAVLPTSMPARGYEAPVDDRERASRIYIGRAGLQAAGPERNSRPRRKILPSSTGVRLGQRKSIEQSQTLGFWPRYCVMFRGKVIPMSDIPGLRLAPMRMIALVGQRGHQLDSGAPTSTPTERYAAGSSDPRFLAAKPLEVRVLAAKPLEVKERTITNADTTPAMQTRVVHFTSNHSERMGDAYDAPERDISFDEFLDVVNPLHHIPIVGTIYRAITGDEISPSASIFGGFLFGGPLGFVTAIAGAIFEEASGQDLGDTVLAALVGDDTLPDVQTAQTTPSASSTTVSLDRIRIDKVERIHAVDGIADGDSNQPRSALDDSGPYGLKNPTRS